MDPNPDTTPTPPSPGLFRYVLGFLLVGAAWGLTTPFMRRAALSSTSTTPESRSWLTHPNTPWLKAKVWGVIYGVYDTLKNPAYAVPFLINVTGSVWFFLLIGQAGELLNLCSMRGKVEDDEWLMRVMIELSLTVPITNSLAFLFTVLGEWWAEKKVITKGELCTLLLICGIVLANYDLEQIHGSAWHWYLVALLFAYIPRTHDHSIVLSSGYGKYAYRFLLQGLYSNHDRCVLVPAQERILSIPRLCVLNIGPTFEKVLMRHDTSELSSDGTIDCFIDRKVCGEEDIEEALVDLEI
jgi:hypothetical protein